MLEEIELDHFISDDDKKRLDNISSPFLTKLQGSVISIEGKFSNSDLNEEDIYFYHVTDSILCSESNYGRNIAKGYKVKKKKKKKIKPNSKRSKRKAQGNGSQFNSMIQFHVKSQICEGKVYKIKKFRKETFGVPGVLKSDFSDVIPSLIKLRDYLRYIHLEDDIFITDIFATLVNYKCRIKDKNLIVLLRNTIKELNLFKKDPYGRNCILQILLDSNRVNYSMMGEIMKYIHINRFDMAEIKYEPERTSSLITVKFNRPNVRLRKKKDTTSKSTIKIFQSGKLNLDSIKSIDEAIDLYRWLNTFFQTKDVLFDITQQGNSSDSSDLSE